MKFTFNVFISRYARLALSIETNGLFHFLISTVTSNIVSFAELKVEKKSK
jgi:hypothetical protein